MPERTPEEAVRFLGQFNTISELRDFLGEPTKEEKNFITSLDLESPLTDEEITILGPDFVDRVVAKTLEKIHREG